MKKIINFPAIKIEANYVFGEITYYSIYVNDEFHGTYVSKGDLNHELLMLQITELNRGLNKI